MREKIMGKDVELSKYLKSMDKMKGVLKQQNDNKKNTALQSTWNEQYKNNLISEAQRVIAVGSSAGKVAADEANRILSKAGKTTSITKTKLDPQLDASIKTSMAKAQKAITLKKAAVSSPALAATTPPARTAVAPIAAATKKLNTAPPNINQIDMTAVNQAKLIFGNKMTKKQPAKSSSTISNFVSKTKGAASVSAHSTNNNEVNKDAVTAARAVMSKR